MQLQLCARGQAQPGQTPGGTREKARKWQRGRGSLASVCRAFNGSRILEQSLLGDGNKMYQLAEMGCITQGSAGSSHFFFTIVCPSVHLLRLIDYVREYVAGLWDPEESDMRKKKMESLRRTCLRPCLLPFLSTNSALVLPIPDVFATVPVYLQGAEAVGLEKGPGEGVARGHAARGGGQRRQSHQGLPY